MEKRKIFYVCDLRTKEIAGAIKKAFPEAIVIIDTQESPLLATKKHKISKKTKKRPAVYSSDSLPDSYVISKETHVDYFIISTVLISADQSLIKKLKDQYGSSESLFIGVAILPYFIKEHQSYGDYVCSKTIFENPKKIQEFFEEKKL